MWNTDIQKYENYYNKYILTTYTFFERYWNNQVTNDCVPLMITGTVRECKWFLQAQILCMKLYVAINPHLPEAAKLR